MVVNTVLSGLEAFVLVSREWARTGGFVAARVVLRGTGTVRARTVQ